MHLKALVKNRMNRSHSIQIIGCFTLKKIVMLFKAYIKIKKVRLAKEYICVWKTIDSKLYSFLYTAVIISITPTETLWIFMLKYVITCTFHVCLFFFLVFYLFFKAFSFLKKSFEVKNDNANLIIVKYIQLVYLFQNFNCISW